MVLKKRISMVSKCIQIRKIFKKCSEKGKKRGVLFSRKGNNNSKSKTQIISLFFSSLFSYFGRFSHFFPFFRLLKRFLLLDAGDFFVEFLNAAEPELSKPIEGKKRNEKKKFKKKNSKK